MDPSDRPAKMRKLSHEASGSEEAVDLPSNSDAQTAQGNEPGENQVANGPEKQIGDALPAPTETAPLADFAGDGEAPMSKNQLKKIRKKQEWESKRDERKVIRKEKLVAKRERKREAKQKLEAEGGETEEAKKKRQEEKAKRFLRPIQMPVTIVIDCDFDDLMHDGERISLGAQVTRAYSDNRNSRYRSYLTVCSFGGKLKERFETVMEGMYKSWRNVRFLDEDFVETGEKAKQWMTEEKRPEFKGAFAKYHRMSDQEKQALKEQGEVVYLSSEADETLDELKPYSTYIIGGLVDKNREKGICHKRATQRGVRTAKLPIGQYLDMSSRKVLATNHVNEIMVKWFETGNWGKAFMEVIPKRKGGKLKDEDGKEKSGAEPTDGSGQVEDESAPANEQQDAGDVQVAVEEGQDAVDGAPQASTDAGAVDETS